MRRLILIFTIWTLTQAKPETYREKEDFQYSRSSSDDGHKSGYYGAQRGNMGGNFEKSHNMDSLAQHQMSGLVRQVEGELGDTSKAREGNVFSAANSRGFYGSGTYDLSNLQGRNFGEGTTFYDSQASQSQSGYAGHSTHSSQSMTQSSQHHDRRSEYGGYQYRGQAGQTIKTDDHQSMDLSSGRYGYGSETGSSRYSQSGHSDQSRQSDSQLSSDIRYRGSSDSQASEGDYRSSDQLRSRLIGGGQSSTIIIRPGTRVSVPVAVQSSYDQRSEADSDHRSSYPSSGNPKYYESSSSYRKEWEKHDTRPMVVPLAVPSTPTRSELFDDVQVEQISDKQYDASATDSRSSHGYSRYNTNAQTSSSQLRHQSDYSSQRQESTGFHSDGTSGSVGRSSNLIGEVTSKPKSYQSSYSYHKAWERQGDPYVIIPNTKGADDHASQRLSSGYDQRYGSQSRQSSTGYAHGCSIQCDETSHLRVSRSVDNTGDEPYQSQIFDIFQEETGQQEQTGWGNVEDLGQQSQSGWDQLQDFGQQSQSTLLFPYGQQPQTDDLTNFEQQSQAKNENLNDFGQQVQSSWDNVQVSDLENKEELTEQQTKQKDQLEDLSQHLQSATEKVKKFEVQLPDKNDKTEYFDQKIVDKPEGNVQLQQTQDKWHDIRSSGKQTQNSLDQLGDIGQETQQSWGKFVPEQAVDLQDYSQQTQEATLHETVNTNNPIKPVWEQGQEDSLTHGTSSGSEQNTHWQEVSQSTNTQRQSHSLQELWGMIENFEKESSKPNDDGSIQANSQNTDFDWKQTRVPGSMTDSSLSENSHHLEHHAPTQALGGQNSNSKTNHSEVVPLHDSGRGDISDLDESLLSVTTVKTKPIQDKVFSEVHLYEPEKEIDSLSLKENNNSKINVDLQSSDADHQKSDSTLSVLSIQDWLNQEKQHESTLQYKPIKPIPNVEQHDPTLGQRPLTQESQEKLLEQTPEEIHQSQLGFDQGQKTESLEQQVQSTWSGPVVPEVLQKPKQTSWEKLEDLGQVQDSSSKSDDSIQQSQSHWSKSEDLGQQTQTAWGSSENIGQEVQSGWEKSEDLGQQTQTAWGSSENFGQQVHSGWEKSEDLGQQTQTAWGSSDDFSQQVQTSWQPSGHFQRSETQQTQNFGSLRSDSDHAQHFYEQNFKTPIVNEDIQTHEVHDLQVPHKLATTVPTTTEVITEKPGFWRGVGNKLSNAKNTVYSWFSRS